MYSELDVFEMRVWRECECTFSKWNGLFRTSDEISGFSLRKMHVCSCSHFTSSELTTSYYSFFGIQIKSLCFWLIRSWPCVRPSYTKGRFGDLELRPTHQGLHSLLMTIVQVARIRSLSYLYLYPHCRYLSYP